MGNWELKLTDFWGGGLNPFCAMDLFSRLIKSMDPFSERFKIYKIKYIA